jgi:hypothetical protein
MGDAANLWAAFVYESESRRLHRLNHESHDDVRLVPKCEELSGAVVPKICKPST